MKGYESFKPLMRTVPNFPKLGIDFKDITLLLNSPGAFSSLIGKMCKEIDTTDLDFIVGIEARGFIFGAAIAAQLGLGFVPIRKLGKLPSKVISETYELEYGVATLEIHEDAFRYRKQSNVLIVDDVLATGGTALAAIELVKKLEGTVVGLMFLMDIPKLGGEQALADYETMIIMDT